MIDKDFEEKLSSLISLVRDQIKSVEVVGSYANPYIKDSQKDYDINIYFETKKDREDACKLFYRDFSLQSLREMGIDLHFVDKTLDVSNKVYVYQTMFIQPILGYERVLPKIDILQDIPHTKKVIKSLLDFTRRKEQETGYPMYANKYWYHAYTELCIITNNSYDLVEEQIDNINLLHDRKEEDQNTRKELIDEMIKEIELWQI